MKENCLLHKECSEFLEEVITWMSNLKMKLQISQIFNQNFRDAKNPIFKLRKTNQYPRIPVKNNQ